MCIETNKEWSELLKSAVIAMNSTRKKSHGYTAFRVMWGRESRYEELLSIDDISSTSAEDFECEETIVDEFPLDEENKFFGFQRVQIVRHLNNLKVAYSILFYYLFRQLYLAIRKVYFLFLYTGNFSN